MSNSKDIKLVLAAGTSLGLLLLGGAVFWKYCRNKNNEDSSVNVGSEGDELELIDDEKNDFNADIDQFFEDIAKNNEIKRDALVYMISKGYLMRCKDNPYTFEHAPFSLNPIKFPRKHVAGLVDVTKDFQRLYDAVATDSEFLLNTLESTAKADEFIANLIKIYKEKSNKDRSNIRLAVVRNDFMLDQAKGFKQIEYNTIAAGFSYLGSGVFGLHKYLIDRYGDNSLKSRSKNKIHKFAPTNTQIASVFAETIKLFNSQFNKDGKKCFVLRVVQPNERNFIDQRAIDNYLWSQYKIPTITKTLEEAGTQAFIDESGNLIINGNLIGLVYYRSGYSPNDYYNADCWKGRSILEQSSAINCPDVGYHLAGTKRIQQELANEAIVASFVGADAAKRIMDYTAKLWNFENQDQKEGSEFTKLLKKVEESEDYVLKPQREGGGNNYYGLDVGKKLNELSKEDREAYVLMELLKPKSNVTTFVRNSEFNSSESISEVGLFSGYLVNGCDKNKEILNSFFGFIVRSKMVDVNEGGVNSGHSVLDSFVYVD